MSSVQNNTRVRNFKKWSSDIVGEGVIDDMRTSSEDEGHVPVISILISFRDTINTITLTREFYTKWIFLLSRNTNVIHLDIEEFWHDLLYVLQ